MKNKWLLATMFLAFLSSAFAAELGEFYFTAQDENSSQEEVKHNAIFPFDFYKGGTKNLVVYSNNKKESILLNLEFNFKYSNITVRNSGVFQPDPEEKPTRILTYETKENVASKTDPRFNIEAHVSIVPTRITENGRTVSATIYYVAAMVYQDIVADGEATTRQLYGKFYDSLTIKDR